MNDGPHDPTTELASAMVQMHEMYLSAIEAGFTKEEALRIVIGVMVGKD